ncbi:MAG: hypothetical protein R2690_13675 [Acidimicrobiales bacterium]
MRLAVDATPLLGRPTGVGAFARAVLDGVAGCDDLEVTAFALTWRGRHALAPLLPPGVEHLDRALPARPLRAAWRRSDVPRLDGALGRPDVIHGTNFVVPPARAARVVTVHDLTCIRFPELCTADTLEYPALLRRAIAAGAWVHAVSGFVAEECVRCWAPPRSGSSPSPTAWRRRRPTRRRVRPSGPASSAATATCSRSARWSRARTSPVWWRPSSWSPTRTPDVRLVLAGPDGWGAEALTAALRRARHRDRVRRIGWVDATERRPAARRHGLRLPVGLRRFGLPTARGDVGGRPGRDDRRRRHPRDRGRRGPGGARGRPRGAGARLTQVLEDDTVRRDLVVRGGAGRLAPWATTIDGLVALYRRAADG